MKGCRRPLFSNEYQSLTAIPSTVHKANVGTVRLHFTGRERAYENRLVHGNSFFL